MAVRVGRDIGAICRKCGDTWHVVVAVVAGTIAKVECKQCGGRHRYRSPDAAAPRPRAASSRKPGAKPPKNAGPVVEADPTRALRPYQASERYGIGDPIEHPTLGRGVVQALSGPHKIQVWFPDGERVLIHSRG